MTLMRMILIIPLGYLIWQEAWVWVFWLFVGAGLTDLLDGALARQFHWETSFGSFMDPLADKVLCGGIILLLAMQNVIPLWLTVLVIGRELLILGGAGTYQLLFGNVEVQPLQISKVNTGVLIFVLVFVLAELASIPLLAELAHWLIDPWAYLALASLVVISGSCYVYIWGRRAGRAWRARVVMENKQS